jgi:hypothetical protein
MDSRIDWLDPFSPATWQEFLDAGGDVSGFRRNRWGGVREIGRGDSLLCDSTRVSRATD